MTTLAACALAMAAATAGAQDKRIELSGTIGWTYSDGVTGKAVAVPGVGVFNTIDPLNSNNWGGRLGFMVGSNLEVGARYDRQASTLQLGGTAIVNWADINITNYHGYAAYNFGDPGGRLRPYILGGLGATGYGAINATAGNVTREIGGRTQFSSTWALGVKLFPSPRFGIRLEAGWTPTYIKSDAAGYWCDPYWGCYVVSDAQFSNQFSFVGGLTFRF
jgi:hypothetical protein